MVSTSFPKKLGAEMPGIGAEIPGIGAEIAGHEFWLRQTIVFFKNVGLLI